MQSSIYHQMWICVKFCFWTIIPKDLGKQMKKFPNMMSISSRIIGISNIIMTQNITFTQ